MVDLNLKELQSFLDLNEIPRIKPKPKTFLGIAKQPHYENVWSNIYSFYFNSSEEHQFQDLFISSLLSCVAKSKLGLKKQALQSFIDFRVQTEYPTIKDGRIDLVLYSDEQAIIIENKVYHTLNNDLDDYWNSVKINTNENENKIGVILTLHPVSEFQFSGFKHAEHYINITHLQLLEEVMSNSGNYIMQASGKYFTIFKDFYQNILNMSKSVINHKDLDFYFTNQEKINQLTELKNAVRNLVISEIELACIKLGGVDDFVLHIPSEAKDRARNYKRGKKQKVMITVLFNEMFTNEKRLKLIVKLEGDVLNNKEQYKAIQFTQDEHAVLDKEFYTNSNNSWAYFAKKEYVVPNDMIENLSGFIINKLEKDNLLSIFNKLHLFLEKRNQ